mmetsp:Transcript_38793/g.93767  ORF Transcript_38793/g.93767 Transcript_38793/m.93767 type:complete len:201 (-) Transcript_38793:3-605(-)
MTTSLAGWIYIQWTSRNQGNGRDLLGSHNHIELLLLLFFGFLRFVGWFFWFLSIFPILFLVFFCSLFCCCCFKLFQIFVGEFFFLNQISHGRSINFNIVLIPILFIGNGHNLLDHIKDGFDAPILFHPTDIPPDQFGLSGERNVWFFGTLLLVAFVALAVATASSTIVIIIVGHHTTRISSEPNQEGKDVAEQTMTIVFG